MASYSVAQAKNRLPSLLKAAAGGEEVVITRRGEPIATLTAIAPASTVGIAQALEQLRLFRETLPPAVTSGAEIIRRMRDEEPGF